MTAQKRTTAIFSCRPFLLFDQILAVEFLFRKLLCGVLMYELEYYRREGNEKHNTDKAEELAAKQCRKERPQRRKPHAAANHMRVDELIFRELHRLIDDQAQQRLLRGYFLYRKKQLHIGTIAIKREIPEPKVLKEAREISSKMGIRPIT